MHGCTCDKGTFMIKAHATIHRLRNRRMAGEENYLTGACTLECGSFLIASDDNDGPFGKYRQTDTMQAEAQPAPHAWKHT